MLAIAVLVVEIRPVKAISGTQVAAIIA